MCPFIEEADGRCAEHLTFGNLTYAFAYCAGDHTACPVYQELIAKQRCHGRSENVARFLAAS